MPTFTKRLVSILNISIFEDLNNKIFKTDFKHIILISALKNSTELGLK